MSTIHPTTPNHHSSSNKKKKSIQNSKNIASNHSIPLCHLTNHANLIFPSRIYNSGRNPKSKEVVSFDKGYGRSMNHCYSDSSSNNRARAEIISPRFGNLRAFPFPWASPPNLRSLDRRTHASSITIPPPSLSLSLALFLSLSFPCSKIKTVARSNKRPTRFHLLFAIIS